MDALFSSLAQLQNALDQAHIGSALIGGVAVAVWGEPRLTRDVDVKVAILSPNYQSAYGKPDEVAHQMGMIFLQDESGTRIDILLADMPFDRMGDCCSGNCCTVVHSRGSNHLTIPSLLLFS